MYKLIFKKYYLMLLVSLAFFSLCLWHVYAFLINQPSSFKINNQSFQSIPLYTFKVIKCYPHNIHHFTEGLLIYNNFLYESTGLRGHSNIIKSDLTQNKVLIEKKLANRYFGEGITILHHRLYQLTLEARKGFIYRADSIKPLGEFHYARAGWGLTTDGQNLIMSDGSSNLYYLNPKTFHEIKQIKVTANQQKIKNLNELEYVHGIIYANVWQTNLIAKISAKTGRVIGWIDLSKLNPNPQELIGDNVLNGIAYDEQTKHFLITGKNWPEIYEVGFIKERI